MLTRWDGLTLKPEYEKLYVRFLRRDLCCSCHLHPPCSHCTDEGNPSNLFETDEAWEHPLKNAVRRVVEENDICGLCSRPGADKHAEPNRWPGERAPDRPRVHGACERAEGQRARGALTEEERRGFLDLLD